MPASSHRRPSRRPATPTAPLIPLAQIMREEEQWRRSQPGKPGRGAWREFWKTRDAQHGQRPDYQLWRHTLCPECPPEPRQDIATLAARALRARDPEVGLTTLLLTSGWLLEADRGPAAERLRPLLQAEKTHLAQALPDRPEVALILWLAATAAREAPEPCLTAFSTLCRRLDPAWKPGRAPDLAFLTSLTSLPASAAQISRWLVAALRPLASGHAAASERALWQMVAWRLQQEASAPILVHIPLLLEIVSSWRLAHHGHEATRLAALALHLLPERAPAPLLHRCQVLAWRVAEAGLSLPRSLRVALDDLPFPGEPPASEKGQESTRLFFDSADSYHARLAEEVAADADWQTLRQAGIVLHHPLAALAWIAKKAQSYALKKQIDVLQAASRLSLRHHSLVTYGRLLAEWPESAEKVIAFAELLRQSQRRMPLLRDAATWQTLTQCLRLAWGKLEPEAIRDDETLFGLHELLLDRDSTLTRCLPGDLRDLSLRHLHSRRTPTALVQALLEDPRRLQSLEHQRNVELWSLASEMRERPEWAESVWVSVVFKGEPSSGRYSWIVQSRHGRQSRQGRLRAAASGESPEIMPLWQEINTAITSLGESSPWLLLATDSAWLKGTAETALNEWRPSVIISHVPSWEWAFRVFREASPSVQEWTFELLQPESATPLDAAWLAAPSSDSLAQTCLLVSTEAEVTAATRWHVHGAPVTETRRSRHLGRHPIVVSTTPWRSGDWSDDLGRLSLAQATRHILTPRRTLTEAEQSVLREALISPTARPTMAQRLDHLIAIQPGLWTLHGLPLRPLLP